MIRAGVGEETHAEFVDFPIEASRSLLPAIYPVRVGNEAGNITEIESFKRQGNVSLSLSILASQSIGECIFDLEPDL